MLGRDRQLVARKRGQRRSHERPLIKVILVNNPKMKKMIESSLGDHHVIEDVAGNTEGSLSNEEQQAKTSDSPTGSHQAVQTPPAISDEEFQDAVATMMWRSDLYARPLYDHVSAIVRHLFYNQGKENFWSGKLDLLSRLVKRHNVPPVGTHFIKPGYINATELTNFQKVRDFFLPFDDDVKRTDHAGTVHQGVGYAPPDHPLKHFPPPAALGAVEDGDPEGSEPKVAYKPVDMYEWLFYAQEGGLGFSETEMYLAMTAVQRFQKLYYNDLQRMRFWGRIDALQNPYYVIECEFKDGSEKWYEKPAALEARPDFTSHKVTVYNPFGTYGFVEEAEESPFSLGQEKYPVPAAPTIDPDQQFKETMVEECGSGANMYCYYVCQDLVTAEWQRLPDVTPNQIRKARFLKHGFTGNLNSKVLACPVFPGTEQSYLRAQIARITHGTTIGPIGQYLAPEEEEERSAIKFKLTEDPEFEFPSLKDILSKNFDGYGHNLPFILRQGRCTWWDPSPGKYQRGNDAEEEETEEEDEEGPEEGVESAEEKPKKRKKLRAKMETGPAIFSPVTEDKETAPNVPAWSVRPSCNVLPQNGVVKLCSTLWPGAICIIQQTKAENFYVGCGLKNAQFT